MIIAGIDPSLTRTGIAVLQDGIPVHLTSSGWHGSNCATYQERNQRIVSLLRGRDGIIDKLRGWLPHIDLVVMEGPEAMGTTGHAFDRAALWHGVYSAVGGPVAVINPTTLKIWATGKGQWPKGMAKKVMLENVRPWWPDVKITNHDIADACALATIGAARLGDPVPFELKDRHKLKLDEVAWPELPA